MAYVELSDLAKSFGGHPAVRGLDLALDRGELVSLLGPSGCGKTTTLRMIAGFETPDAGEVWVGGQNVLPLPAHRRGMGVIFQSYALFPHLTAWGNVAFGMIIPKDGTVGMLFAQYISAVAPHPNAAKLAIDFLFSDEGQVMLAQGYAHPSRKVALPGEVAAKMLPESAHGTIRFPTSLPAFSAAIKKIADGWNAIATQ